MGTCQLSSEEHDAEPLKPIAFDDHDEAVDD